MPLSFDDARLLAALRACYRAHGEVRHNDVARRLGHTADAVSALLADPVHRARLALKEAGLAASVERLVSRSRRLREINQGQSTLRAADQSGDYVRRAIAEGLPLPDDAYYDALLPATPTSARPGSPGKIAEMTRRAARFEVLFHPEDGCG